jgi:phosphoserine phosphatase
MKIGLFLDVDKTLTRDFVEDEYSRALGCHDECLIEDQRLKRKEISAQEHSRRIARLFSAKAFTLKRARELYDRVLLQPWTDELLNIPGVDTFLVSTGPSYFIDTLAKQFGIPQERTISSRYTFSPVTGLLLDSVDLVTGQQKATFVEDQKTRYDITIGIGDDAESDGPFVSHCTIPLLTVETEGYIHISDLNSAVLVIQRLARVSSTSSGRLAPGPGPTLAFDPKQLTIAELFQIIIHTPFKIVISLGSILFGALTIAFGLGKWLR